MKHFYQTFWWDMGMRRVDETFWWDIVMRYFDEIFWWNILWDILLRHFDEIFWWDIVMRHMDETHWWDILMGHIDETFVLVFYEFSGPVMSFKDLWYGDDVDGMALWQFWLSLFINLFHLSKKRGVKYKFIGIKEISLINLVHFSKEGAEIWK